MSPRELVAAGDAGRRVAEGVRGVDTGTPVRSLAEALPGGAVAATAADVARTWGLAVAAVADGMVRQAEGLGAAAAAYDEAERAANAALITAAGGI